MNPAADDSGASGAPSNGSGRGPHGGGVALQAGAHVRGLRVETDGLRWRLWLRHNCDENCGFSPAGLAERTPRWAAGATVCQQCRESFGYPLIDLTGRVQSARGSAETQAVLEAVRRERLAAQ